MTGAVLPTPANMTLWFLAVGQDVVPALLNLTSSVFPVERIWTPPELVLHGGSWPSMNDLVAMGKRVMFVSGADYGLAMSQLIFTKWVLARSLVAHLP